MAYIVENVPVLTFDKEFVVEVQVDIISAVEPGPLENSGQVWPHKR